MRRMGAPARAPRISGGCSRRIPAPPRLSRRPAEPRAKESPESADTGAKPLATPKDLADKESGETDRPDI